MKVTKQTYDAYTEDKSTPNLGNKWVSVHVSVEVEVDLIDSLDEAYEMAHRLIRGMIERHGKKA